MTDETEQLPPLDPQKVREINARMESALNTAADMLRDLIPEAEVMLISRDYIDGTNFRVWAGAQRIADKPGMDDLDVALDFVVQFFRTTQMQRASEAARQGTVGNA